MNVDDPPSEFAKATGLEHAAPGCEGLDLFQKAPVCSMLDIAHDEADHDRAEKPDSEGRSDDRTLAKATCPHRGDLAFGAEPAEGEDHPE